MRHPHYDPNQPRVPAGRQGGGQWTDGKDRQLWKLRAAFLTRDARLFQGTRPPARTSPSQRSIPNAPSRPTAPGPLLPWPANPPFQPGTRNTPLQPWMPNLTPPSPNSDRVSEMLELYDGLSEHNDDQQQAVLVLGREYWRDPGEQFRLLDARLLTREAINELCKKGLEKVQKWTNDAVEGTKKYRENMLPGPYGTDVHLRVEQMINGLSKKDRKVFGTEKSFEKMKEDGVAPAESEHEERTNLQTNREVPRGAKDSIRIDVIQRIDSETVCIYDIKTGGRGLSRRRFNEIVRALAKADPKIKRIIITEVRPKDTWRPSRRLSR